MPKIVAAVRVLPLMFPVPPIMSLPEPFHRIEPFVNPAFAETNGVAEDSVVTTADVMVAAWAEEPSATQMKDTANQLERRMSDL